jgi:hypothetical protein
MSIKRSFLESKWYYRIARLIFFEVIPVLIMIGIIWKLFPNIIGKSLEDIIIILQSNSSIIAIACTLLVPAGYLVILNGIWRGFFYIFFGGVEDDTKPKVIAAVPPIGQVNQPIVAQDSSASVVNYLKEAKSKEATASAVMGLIILIVMYFAFKPSSTSTSGGGSVKTNTNTSTSTCIPTGCGSNWHCSGSYYSNNVRKEISGCYVSSQSSLPSWTGICRRCPN